MGIAYGMLVVGLAIPTQGCIDGLMCGENCFGDSPCAQFDFDECGLRVGCKVGEHCECALADCESSVATACRGHATQAACDASASCSWRPACLGMRDCLASFDDAATCNAQPGCTWEKHCN